MVIFLTSNFQLDGGLEFSSVTRKPKLTGPVTCPRCDKMTHNEHDRRLRGKVIFLTLIKRWF